MLFLAHLDGHDLAAGTPGPWRELRSLRPGLVLVDSAQTRSVVYHALKAELPRDTPLLVAELHEVPKFKGMASGALAWARGLGDLTSDDGGDDRGDDRDRHGRTEPPAAARSGVPTPVTADELTLTTDRLVLRPFTAADLPAMADMHAREDVARYLLWEPRDEAASRAALEEHFDLSFAADGDAICLAGVERDTGAFVGEFLLALTSVEHRGGEVGYILHPDHHGEGYATEGARAMLGLGFDRLDRHRIVGRLDARNTASARVLEKLGMRREAHLVRNERIGGEWTDELVYAMLAEERGR